MSSDKSVNQRNLLNPKALEALALDHLKRAIRINNGHSQSITRLCSHYLSNGQLNDAKKLVEESLNFEPQNQDLIYLQALLFYKNSKYTEALNKIQCFLSSTRENLRFLKLAQKLYNKLHDLTNLQYSLEKLIEIDPNNWEHFSRLSNLLQEPEDYHRAILLLEIAWDLSNQNKEILIEIIRRAGTKSFFDEEGVLHRRPDLPLLKKYLHLIQETTLSDVHRHQVGQILFECGMHEACRFQLNKIEAKPLSNFYLIKGLSDYHLGDLQKAKLNLLKVTPKNKQYCYALYYLAKIDKKLFMPGFKVSYENAIHFFNEYICDLKNKMGEELSRNHFHNSKLIETEISQVKNYISECIKLKSTSVT